ncbi:hypothetical protein ABDK56_03445 [Sphingomonas sp. ASV193]|uniref:hypothetical protein n=1 Tax=Sphingomonas sp. ASV193 TaxID=3144405 RepID=UPI0032E8C280
MVAMWVAIVGAMIAVAVHEGGTDCDVPASGPFHWLMRGRHYVVAHAGRTGCVEVANSRSLDRS